VTMKARAFFFAHFGRLTISWTTGARSGVRWSGPATPVVGHAGIESQSTAAVVRARVEMLFFLVVNAGALSIAWPSKWSDVGPDRGASTLNWIHARTMPAPFGMVTVAKRSPTI